MRSLPTSPRLRRILAAYTINRLGTWFGYVALAVGVYDATHSALAVAGLYLAGGLLPALTTPALVARIERSERRGGLSLLYLLEALTAIGLAALLWHFWLPGVLILAAIDNTAALAASALLRGAAAHIAVQELDTGPQTPSGSDEDEAVELAQREANAALNISYTATVAVGPVAAALLVAAAGGPTALLIDAATFLICAALLLDLTLHIEESGDSSVRSRLATAWEYVRTAPTLRAILIVEAVAIVFFTAGTPVEILYAKATLGVGDVGYGVLLAVWGAGQFAGGLIFARSMRRSLGLLLAGGTLAVGLAYIGFAIAPSLAVACGFAIVGGVGNGIQWAALISSVQRLTPQSLQGRLMGAVESIGAFSPALGFVLGGLVATLTSPRGAFLVAGIAATALTGVFLRIFRAEAQAPAGQFGRARAHGDPPRQPDWQTQSVAALPTTIPEQPPALAPLSGEPGRSLREDP